MRLASFPYNLEHALLTCERVGAYGLDVKDLMPSASINLVV